MRKERKVYVSPATFIRGERRFMLGICAVSRRGNCSVFKWIVGEFVLHDPTHRDLFHFYSFVAHARFGGKTARELFHERFGRKEVEETTPLEIAA